MSTYVHFTEEGAEDSLSLSGSREADGMYSGRKCVPMLCPGSRGGLRVGLGLREGLLSTD